jgi:glycosyltransferase involved in cell wall biosynthesis
VIGDGPDGRRLRRLAGPTIRFTGRVPDAEVAALLSSARALVVPGTEEFGIAAVEAQAAGRPVIALRDGGVRETVLEGVTGTFFERSDPDALAAAVTGFDPLGVDPDACVRNARRFGREPFVRGMRRAIRAALGEPELDADGWSLAAPAPATEPAR